MKKLKIENQLRCMIDFIEIKKLKIDIAEIKETNLKQELIDGFNLEVEKHNIIKKERAKLARIIPFYIG